MCDLFKSQSLSGTLSSMRESINDEFRQYPHEALQFLANKWFDEKFLTNVEKQPVQFEIQ